MSYEPLEGVEWCATHSELIDEANDNRCRARDFTSTPCLWVPLYTTPIGGEVEILDWYVNQLTEALNVLHFCDDRMDSFAFSELSSVLDEGWSDENCETYASELVRLKAENERLRNNLRAMCGG